MVNKNIIDRALPERTKLMFYFPTPSKGESHYVIELPFYENIQINESKKARYQKYSLISRSSNLYSYQGADSRIMTLSFNISLPHLLEEHPDINLDRFVSYKGSSENLEEEKKRFSQPQKANTSSGGLATKLGTQYTRTLAKESATMVINSLWMRNSSIPMADIIYLRGTYGVPFAENNIFAAEHVSVFDGFVETDDNNRMIGIDFAGWQEAKDKAQEDAAAKFEELNSHRISFKKRNQIIDIIIYWTNIIRSSVVNYTKNPIYGPPIIRLNHGILYQDVPCICTDYTISYNEAAGYDTHTLLPRQLKFTMKLEEIRAGDFGEFDPGDTNNPIKRDNLAGWEAVILGETNSMDPGYGDL